jgi:hypothetical protein
MSAPTDTNVLSHLILILKDALYIVSAVADAKIKLNKKENYNTY